jgi:hypothetical protein
VHNVPGIAHAMPAHADQSHADTICVHNTSDRVDREPHDPTALI